MKYTRWILRATPVLVLAGLANAQGLGTPTEIHDVPVAWGFVAGGYTPRQIPQFDGQLTAVRIIVCRFAAAQFKTENMNANAPAVHYFGDSPLLVEEVANAVGVEARMNTISGPFLVNSTSGGTQDGDAHFFDVSMSLGAYDGLLDFSGPSGDSTGQINSGLHVDRTIILPGDPLFASFQGQSTVNLMVRRMGAFTVSSETAPFVAEVTGWAGARIHVHYFGTPNPQP